MRAAVQNTPNPERVNALRKILQRRDVCAVKVEGGFSGDEAGGVQAKGFVAFIESQRQDRSHWMMLRRVLTDHDADSEVWVMEVGPDGTFNKVETLTVRSRPPQERGKPVRFDAQGIDLRSYGIPYDAHDVESICFDDGSSIWPSSGEAVAPALLHVDLDSVGEMTLLPNEDGLLERRALRLGNSFIKDMESSGKALGLSDGWRKHLVMLPTLSVSLR